MQARVSTDVAELFAKNVVRTKYEGLPKESVETIKKLTLDTLGVVIAASGITLGLKKLVELVEEGGGKEESTILGYGIRVPALMSSFVNGAMAHCLDYDDIHSDGQLHTGSITIVPALAIAERLGGVNGKDFITAVALGVDIMIRLGLCIHYKQDWLNTPLFGVFAGAASAGKLLGLDEGSLVDALGIAFCQSACTMELRLGVGSDIGGMRDAFATKGSVLSALMAERGISGIKTPFEGKAGLFNVYFNGEYKRNILTNGLGEKFDFTGIGFKPWPACSTTHMYIDATLQLVSENDLKPEDIRQITPYVGDYANYLCEPLEARRHPTTTMDAKFSIPYTIAVAVVKKKVSLSDFTPEGIKERKVLQFTPKVKPKFDAAFNYAGTEPPAMVEIKTEDGKVHSRRIDFALGNPRKPLSTEALLDKFIECASYSIKPVKGEPLEKVIEQIMNLEKVDDVAQIVKLLV